jgi:hypothetical protein
MQAKAKVKVHDWLWKKGENMYFIKIVLTDINTVANKLIFLNVYRLLYCVYSQRMLDVHGDILTCCIMRFLFYGSDKYFHKSVLMYLSFAMFECAAHRFTWLWGTEIFSLLTHPSRPGSCYGNPVLLPRASRTLLQSEAPNHTSLIQYLFSRLKQYMA